MTHFNKNIGLISVIFASKRNGSYFDALEAALNVAIRGIIFSRLDIGSEKSHFILKPK
jgi:hypothetical protein